MPLSISKFFKESIDCNSNLFVFSSMIFFNKSSNSNFLRTRNLYFSEDLVLIYSNIIRRSALPFSVAKSAKCLSTLFVQRGVPVHLRSDNGTEFTAQAVRTWLMRLGVKTLYIEPGSPWENGYSESFNGKLRDEVLNREIFDTLHEAKVLVERWRNE